MSRGFLQAHAPSSARLGAALLSMGVFGLRHSLLDLSPQGMDPGVVGWQWLVLLVIAGVLILFALVVALVT